MVLSFFKAWQGIQKFNSLNNCDREIVFYAEDSDSWVHFESMIDSLNKVHKKKIYYLTSSLKDPILNQENSLITSIYIGEGLWRTVLFNLLKADTMIMTMPDLDTFHIKRSRYPVHYIYIFHNILSTHMVFRKGAYDNYDTIFCCGPHHQKEIKRTEELYSLPSKNLFNHGYGRIDSLLKALSSKHRLSFQKNQKPKILIAPSWGKNCILETCGIDLIKLLVNGGYDVTVRPHPMTRRNNPKKLDQIKNLFKNKINFFFEENISSYKSLIESHIMISDWSGAALEFAFCMERPVLFIDVPRKVNNPEYERLEITPFEIHIRSEIGRILPLENINEIDIWVDDMYSNLDEYSEKSKKARLEWVYNLERSGEKGAQEIIDILTRIKSRDTF